MNPINPKWLALAERLKRRVYPTVRRPRWRQSRRSTAIHEGAHCVLMEHTGRTCGGATIDPRRAARGMAGQAFAGSPMPREQRAMREPDAPLPAAIFPDHQSLVLCWAAMLFAGREAECRLRGITLAGFVEWHDPDAREAEWLLSTAFGPRRGSTPAAGAQALARAMVAELWPQIERVAEQLLQHGTLDGDAIRRAMAGATTEFPPRPRNAKGAAAALSARHAPDAVRADSFPRACPAADGQGPAIPTCRTPGTPRADLHATALQ